jgi:hypothetical protein
MAFSRPFRVLEHGRTLQTGRWELVIVREDLGRRRSSHKPYRLGAVRLYLRSGLSRGTHRCFSDRVVEALAPVGC